MVGVLVTLGVAHPSVAEALVIPPEHTEDVAKLLEKGGTRSIPGIASEVAEEWYIEEHRPYPGSPSSEELHRQLTRLRQRVGLLPKLAKIGRIAMGGVAGLAVWEIGGLALKAVINEQVVPPGGTGCSPFSWPAFPSVKEKCVHTATHQMFRDDDLVLNGETVMKGPMVIYTNSTGSGSLQEVEPGEYRCEYVRLWNGPGQRLVHEYQQSSNYCAGGYSTQRTVYFARPIGVGEFSPGYGPAGEATHTITADAEYEKSPPSAANIGSRIQSELDTGEYPVAEQFIESQWDEDVPDPRGTWTTVPNCVGSAVAVCIDTLTQAELEVNRVDLNWEGANVEYPAETVVSISPAPSTEILKGATVTIEVNPEEDGMPLVVPEPLEGGETYQEYLQRLQQRGMVGSPSPVSEANSVPSLGPDGVVRVIPKPGTRFAPGGSPPEIEVRHNPSDTPMVPAPDPGSGLCENLSLDAIDISPLNQPVGDKFPFGVVTFFTEMFSDWSEGGGPPILSFKPFPMLKDENGDPVTVQLDLRIADSLVAITRPIMVIGTFLLFLWFLATAFLRMQGDNS